MSTKVLLVGINDYPAAPLRGCVNDALAMRDLLASAYGVAPTSIRMLLDSAATTAAIEDGLGWLAQPDEDERTPVRLFHFSGHGTVVADASGDEPDGQDECIVPFDYQAAGPMNDDTLRALYREFPRSMHLLLVMDSCHSGTVQRNLERDISYRFLPADHEEEQQIIAAAERVRREREAFAWECYRRLAERSRSEEELKQQFKTLLASFDKRHYGQENVRGNVVLLAACKSSQTAADARIGGTFHGALTYYLLETLRDAGAPVSYRVLINRVGKRLYDNQFVQEPQIECNRANRDHAFLRPIGV
ncbi:MAG: caspase family protein [Kouleothrix sp.]|nr:caspase family protein [Kouleothrix sp.]